MDYGEGERSNEPPVRLSVRFRLLAEREAVVFRRFRWYQLENERGLP